MVDPLFGRAWVDDGAPAGVRDALIEVCGEVLPLPSERPWEAVAADELVVLAAGSPHVFATCARLKRPGVRVTVAIACDDEERELVEPIARFCMAEGTVSWRDLIDGPSTVLGGLIRSGKPTEAVDVLLARLEERLGDDVRVLADGVLRGLSTERERSFIESVTDAETGLFQGSFMAFKLEEEFKRSWRFRLPLAVVLFDLPQMNDLGDERGRVLGEVAGVLLNECRDIDVIGRYDDTSFLLLLPSTGANGASVLAHRVLGHLRDQIKAPVQLDPAIAIVAVPRTGVNRKDDLLDLARLTLVSAWAAEGDQRVCLA
ncbi:MAG: hypothetical protein CMJ85_04735 [Planctomycetes bacterium]|jgi:diguanylate cyclase (GGDEF)-like protein|nr:hypothetical protein [Planctomycetota bacterium]